MRVPVGWVLAVGVGGLGFACGGATRGSSAVGDGPGAGGNAGAGGSAGMDGGLPLPVAPALDAIPKSGARIRVGGLSSGDEWLGTTDVIDRDTGLPCELRQAGDGVTRCLPRGPLGRVAFLDAACTQPIFVVPGGDPCAGPPPDFALYQGLTTCRSAEQRVVSRGAGLEPPAVVYGSAEAACLEAVPAPGETFFEAVPSPDSDWVGFERRVIEVTEDLGVEVWEGADGSALWGSFWSLPDDVACRPEGETQVALYTGGPHFCVPSARTELGGRGFFADGACAEEVARVPGCEPSTLIEVHRSGDSCSGGSFTEFFDLGEKLRPGDVTWTVHGYCEPAAPSWLTGFEYHRKGRALPLSGFPALERAEVGEGRLRSLVWVAGGKVVRTEVGRLRDSQSGEACSQVRLADGKLRCVPGAASFGPWGPLYADAACTEPIFDIAYACAPPAGAEPPRFVLGYPEPSGDGCQSFEIATAYRVGALHEGPTYSAAEGCRPAGVAGGDPATVHYRVEEEVDPGEFPEIFEGVR